MIGHELLDIRLTPLNGYIWLCECGESGTPRPSRHAAYCGHGTHLRQEADAAEEAARTATILPLRSPGELICMICGLPIITHPVDLVGDDGGPFHILCSP